MRLILLYFLLASGLFLRAQEASLKAGWINSAPRIDGVQDETTSALPLVRFSSVIPTDSLIKAPDAGFRIAYSASFLYICVEVASDTMICRDRGYQNGDGICVLIGRPQEGGKPTREFYEMGFTAQEEGTQNWQTKFVWYRNVDLAFTRLKDASFKARRNGKKVFMEILLPWSDIYPYHPWISGELAFNITLYKASGTKERIAYSYCRDTLTGQEQRPRNYSVLQFAPPEGATEIQSCAILSANHLNEGESPKLRIAAWSPKDGKFSARAVIWSGEHAAVRSRLIEEPLKQGFNQFEKEIQADLLTGGYSVSWNQLQGNSSGMLYFSVLPADVVAAMARQLEARKPSLSAGSFFTLKFMTEDAALKLAELKDYDAAYSVRVQLEKLKRILDSPEDVIRSKKGSFRRAFLSAVDSTCRPYSVKVPENFDPSKKYPLLVFLHGSAQDDQGVLDGVPKLNVECIQIAPNGRGTSNCYTADHAQEDIEEAIADAIRNYPIDTARILLAGFSMGGYGVYRTFYEHPSRYKALAVFSGSPNLGVKWIGPSEPDFLDEKYLKVFKGVPVFIFHGTKDFNVRIDDTEAFVEKLKHTGANVTFVTEPVGHESPGAGTVEKLNDWIRAEF